MPIIFARASISILLVSLCCSSAAAALVGDELASYNEDTAFGIRTLSHIATAYITYAGQSPGPTVFETMQWITSDIGTTRTLDASNDPAFLAFCTRLTDGIGGDGVSSGDPENVLFFTGIFGVGAGGRRDSEAFFLYGNRNDPRIDLAGSTIHHMTMRLNSVTFTSPGQDLNHDGIWTDVTASFTWKIYAPEPTGLALLPMMVMVLRRRRRA